MDPNELEIEFRIFVLRLAERLSDTETNKLVYICKLPPQYKDKQPMVVLEYMHNMGVFSATKLDNFARLLKEIKRDDLSKTVEKYSKTKKTRKMCAKARASSPEADPSLTTSSQATFEVFNIQSEITRDVMDQMMKRHNDMGLRVRQRAMHDLECLVKSAQDLKKELSTQSNAKDVQEGGEDGYIYSVPHFDDVDSGDDSKSSPPEYMYIENDPSPVSVAFQHHQQPAGRAATLPHAAAQLVTGLSAGQVGVKDRFKLQKPQTLPKPQKHRAEGSGSTALVSPRVVPSSVPHNPAIDLSDLKQKKSSLRKSGSAQKSSLHSSPSLSSMDSDYTGGSSASYTGGSDTTGSTDDSGFGGDIYMNVREAADEYMNTQCST
ncbi:hypothetical protein GBAR_LOCUS19886 [Geodia barretti]|uniref:DED domain-containing protein n=1 Tax=Geodia barretti TaxID=519541 RepID=A0AA35SSN8_GEOBA|nr:hypothetical protein GBAR_LOCUS19886 [Geodia barretti]